MLVVLAAWNVALTLAVPASSTPATVAPQLCPARLSGDRCSKWKDLYRKQQAALAWVNVENAERDADAAIKARDYRLLGAYGYSVEVPGVDGAEFIPNGCGLKMISGTSDYVADHDFSDRPRDYARRYNLRVVARTKCWSKPYSRRGVVWTGGSYEGLHSLSFGVPETGYDYLDLYCDGGPITLVQIRPGAAPGKRRVTFASERANAPIDAKLEAPDPGLRRRDFAYLRATIPATNPVWAEFAETGRLKLDGQPFDAATALERAAIRSFVRACGGS